MRKPALLSNTVSAQWIGWHLIGGSMGCLCSYVLALARIEFSPLSYTLAYHWPEHEAVLDGVLQGSLVWGMFVGIVHGSAAHYGSKGTTSSWFKVRRTANWAVSALAYSLLVGVPYASALTLQQYLESPVTAVPDPAGAEALNLFWRLQLVVVLDKGFYVAALLQTAFCWFKANQKLVRS